MTEEGSGASPPATPHFQIASVSSPAAAAGRARRGTTGRTRLTACIVACALFMQNLDSTVVSTALPVMARAFHADPLHMSVALTSYLLSLAVFIPTSGWMADRFGSRTVFRVAIAVFTLGSVLCGRADTLGFLVFARIIQGVGGAMMLPVGRLVLLRSVAKSELVAAMAWLTVPSMIGPVVGPPLGGLIVTYTSWRWIFDINVPIGLLGIALVSLFIEEVREPQAGSFDFSGLLFSAIALTGLMVGLETVGRQVVAPSVTILMLLAGVAGAVLYALHARGRERPLLDFSLLRLPSFGISVLAGTLFRIGIGAIPFLLPLMLQLGFGDSAAESGMITFASSAGALAMKPATQWALRLIGFRTTLVWNGLLSAGLLAALAAFRPSWPMAAIYAVLLTGGFFRSLQFTAFNTLAYAEVSRARMSAATTLYTTMQQLSQVVGISAGAAALEAASVASGHARPSLGDYSIAFLGVAFVSLLAAPASLLLARDAGAELSGHRASSEVGSSLAHTRGDG